MKYSARESLARGLVHYELGLLTQVEKEFEQAEQQFRYASEITQPSREDQKYILSALYYLAVLKLRYSNGVAQATNYLEHARKFREKYEVVLGAETEAEIHFRLGKGFYQNGFYEKAQFHLESSLANYQKIQPNWLVVPEIYAELYHRLGDTYYELGVRTKIPETKAELFAKAREAYEKAAEFYLKIGKENEAGKALERVFVDFKDDYYKGLLFYELWQNPRGEGEPQGKKKAAEKALEHFRDVQRVVSAKILQYTESGKTDFARLAKKFFESLEAKIKELKKFLKVRE